MSARQRIADLRESGFSDEEIAEWAIMKRQELSDAGFGEAEIDTWLGHPPFNPEPVKAFVQRNLAPPTQLGMGEQQTTGAGRATVTAEEPRGFLEAVQAGLQMSVSGLLARGKPPERLLPADADRLNRIGANVGTIAGDFPFIVGGFLAGGATPITGTAGAFALPAGMRRVLMDSYERGEVVSFGDWWDRASGAIVETVKGLLTGAATAGVGGAVARTLAPLGSPTLQTATILGAQVATMVTVGRALEGEIPEPNDFLDAAIVLGGVKAAGRVAAKLRTIYATTGVRPQDVVQDAARNPAIQADVLSTNRGLPKAYADPVVDVLAKLRTERITVEGEVTHVPGVEVMTTGKLVETSPPLPSIAELAKQHQVAVTRSGQTGAFADPDAEPVPTRLLDRPARTERFPPARGVEFEEPETVAPFEKPGFLQTAEERVQQQSREPLHGAEERISQEPRPQLREQRRFIKRQPDRGVQIEMEDLARQLQEAGVIVGEEAPPRWEQNIPVEDAQRAILDRIVQERPPTKGLGWSGVYTALVDSLHPIKQAERARVESGAEPLPTGESPYQLERLTRGVFGKGVQWIRSAPFAFDTLAPTGKSYQAILKPVANDLDGFRAYMAAKRALELEQRGVETGIPTAEARRVVAGGRERYESVFQERLQYRDALLAYLKDSGILSDKAVRAMREANKAYVPFYRFFEEAETGRPSTAKTVRDPIKAIEGSERKILDPIESDIKDTFLFLSLAEKNAARQAYVRMGPDFVERVRRASDPLTKKELKALLEEHGLRGKAIEEFEAFHPSAYKPGANEIVVFEKGERQVYRVDAEVAKAFNASDRIGADLLSRILIAPASLLRAGVTLSPDFMVRNLIRDALSSFVYASSHPIKTAKGLKSLITQDTAFTRWMNAGGANATMVALDRDYIQAQLFKLNAETGLMERAWNVAKTPLEVLRITSELIENATRLGAVRDDLFRAQDKAQIQALAMMAREATVDFARRGADPSFQQYTRMTAFMNPGIQGLDRMVRAFHDQPVGTLAKSLAAITIPSVLLWWANHDDPRWEDIPRWQKDLFWIVMTPEHIYRIPKPFELGVMFGSLPERLLEQFVDEHPDALRNLDDTLMQAFGINVIPTAAVPVLEQFANRSILTGNPQIPASLEPLLPEYQYTEYTTEAAKALGRILGAFPGLERQAIQADDTLLAGAARTLTTPILIENYVRSWTGGLGLYALQLADKALRAAGQLPDPVTPTPTLADIPVVKAFVVRYPSATAQSIQDFYDDYAEKRRVFDTVMRKAQEGDVAAVERAMVFDRSAMVQLDDLRRALGDHEKMVRLIHKNPDIRPDEQRQLIDTLYGRMIELARHGKAALRTIEQATTREEAP